MGTATPAAAQSDAELTTAVKKRFISERAVPATIKVVVENDGVVKLFGKVNTPFHQKRAEDVARSVDGVRAVINYTTLDLYERADDSIRDDVERALASNLTVESYKVSVRVENGSVVLTGTVDSDVERAAAERAAWEVPGVRQIENIVAVDPPAERSDAELLEDVREQLSWDPKVDEGLVYATVHDGVVHLVGTVADDIQRERVLRTARVEGVQGVDASHVSRARFVAQDESFSTVVPVGAGHATSGPAATTTKKSEQTATAEAALLPVEWSEQDD